MRPLVIGIGGGQSGAGKTTIACKILQSLKGWGAIKYTKTVLYASVTDDIRILSEEGKDTKRFLDAGAEKVLWVQSPFPEVREIISMAVEMLGHLKGIIVEGNSAIRILHPDIVIFVSGPEGGMKEGSEEILSMADIVIAGDEQPLPAMPETAERFSRNDVEACIRWITETAEQGMNRQK
jgi:molybdopterin-guanine dinucleotide biosynthesis protein